ncbi:MAG: bifunctional 23S rRNA (guanine(2069)-N(7))-methyltransferase RlmK/23S rRNA (guanine(2445)-N(2))-methyltransferase RlmL [Thermoguttaceae bacterium]|nr:bifunctional 23S rRNA (guanine(2069)-N(7))-methyltransferase RlmK/23S rRNA (guanine(2445)-N(2))-methyltransferase RlmL [Thermoguttaceae bacterium]MBQ6615283.1 bifunctional 23S rRNA (guanine(2069)-N(7))-methyltransferase RlmK/23S rRNA (guanine(2445)-N(2))-methyltransferase RlmL [Thermoguttaceae bacterium]
MESLQLVATSTMGLESIVARELKAMGFDPKNAESGPGRTYFTGSLDAVVKANIHLRCAGKVLIELASFPCEDFDVLFDAASEIPWEDWAPRNAKVVVEGRSVRSKITSVPALQRTVKKAIVNRLMNAYKTTTLPEDGALYTVEISLLKDHATITLDTTGRGLHRRGYRLMNVAAPLRETLAAGLVLLSNWEPGAPLIDPFCASGTIPIEAAMIGRNIAPGLKRQFDAQSWQIFPPKLWIEARKEAQAAILPPLETKIIGTDIDAQALKFARQHAQLAGVENDIHFQQKDFADLTSQRHYGCIICNPPYGDRIGELAQLRPLYESMPAVFSRLPDWSFYIITAWNDFEKVIGQEATRRRKLYNSRIECTYFQFVGPKRPPKRVWEERNDKIETETPEDESLDNLDNSVTEAPTEQEPVTPHAKASPPAPVFAGLDEYAQYQAEQFGKCLANRAHHLRKLPKRGITCYRLYDRDFPEVPLAIDFYEGEYLHIAEYERPDGRNVGQHKLWLDKMVETAVEVMGVEPRNAFLKRRQRMRGESQYEKFAQKERVIDAHEGGLTFLCNMTDYLDTGLFLDHRITRDMVRKEAAGKRFLNLFCYTGAFSCYAAAGKAASVVSVDLSPNYLEWAEANMELNGFFAPEFPADYVKADVMKFLSRVDDNSFDLCVCDPPTFSNSKSTEQDWDVQKCHVALLRLLAQKMSPGGVVYFSNNFRRFKLDEESLSEMYSIRDYTARTLPEDFRNKHIHQCWRMAVREQGVGNRE